jgi:hypothetical protein
VTVAAEDAPLTDADLVGMPAPEPVRLIRGRPAPEAASQPGQE